uniref:Uncharacterized protein n=1 Tax=Physcomitrium patens TaxID=3218 RepID=A0A2K1JR20_PHYPA|nr:hypothetical protein PHYPA_016366 [Physcomitrium patens]
MLRAILVVQDLQESSKVSVRTSSWMQFISYVHSISLQQDTRMYEEALCAARNASDARHFYPESDSESPVKRMSVIIPCLSVT